LNVKPTQPSLAAGGEAESSIRNSFKLSKVVRWSVSLLLLMIVIAIVGWQQYTVHSVASARIDHAMSQLLDGAPTVVKRQLPSLSREMTLTMQTSDQQGRCDSVQDSVIPALDEHYFQSVDFDGLCGLIWTSSAAKALLGISLDRFSLIDLKKNAFDWRVPLPSRRRVDRPYAMIAVYDNNTKMLTHALNRQRLHWSLNEAEISVADLATWLETQSVDATVYGHTLAAK